MKNTYRRIASSALLAVLISLGAVSAPVSAQTIGGLGSGLKISPVRNDVTLEKGKSQTFSLFIENITNKPVIAHAIVNDFTASNDETGQPRIFVNDNDTLPTNNFKSLVITLPPDASLKPNERKETKVTLAVPSDATSGGYYGVVRFALLDNSQPDVSKTTIGLSASVGSLFLVRVPGSITEKLKLQSFDVEHKGDNTKFFNSGKDLSVVIRFKNEGNIHVQPFGKIILKGWGGKVLESKEINTVDEPNSVLPGSVRKFEIPLSKVGKFGRYTVEGNFGYGTNGNLVSAKTTFYVIPWAFIITVILLILFLIFVAPRLIRRYNQNVLRNAAKNKK